MGNKGVGWTRTRRSHTEHSSYSLQDVVVQTVLSLGHCPIHLKSRYERKCDHHHHLEFVLIAQHRWEQFVQAVLSRR
ncbi:hypothetical protein BDR04DRAFT_1093256 [Suillus decipiens]|nr:hypothetical protein BDR04DRAFT_1093256 [Suillus decipiens]